MLVLKLLVVFIVFIQLNAQNYCARDLCNRGQHIGCNNNGRWAPGCNGQVINMRPYINLILQIHNERRNTVAAGRLSRFPSAVQMATMSWDPELAQIAVFNGLRCRFGHDDCRNTRAFRFAGQNISILPTRNTDIGAFLRRVLEDMFLEHRVTNRADIERYRPRSGPDFGHFTTMVQERNNRVGCAVVQFTTSNRFQATYLVCNYAAGSIINNPIYRFGPPGSQCRTGRNPIYPSLCSVRESYNHNQWG